MSKTKTRKKILNLRKKKYSNNYKIKFSNLINILNKKKINKGIIGGYFPVNYEIDDLKILEKLKSKNYKISLPIIKKSNQLDFYIWSSKFPMKINRYGIPEPLKKRLVYPDVLLVPTVAFDNRKFRLGYGGGYYDRYIEKIKKIKKCLFIGLAFEFQKVKKLKVDEFDQKLNIILTNKKAYKWEFYFWEMW